MTTTNQGVNLVTAITSDHRAVEAVFEELRSGAGSPQHRRDQTDHAIAELVRHCVGEEQYVYPKSAASSEIKPLTMSLRNTPKPRGS